MLEDVQILHELFRKESLILKLRQENLKKLKQKERTFSLRPRKNAVKS